MIHFYYDTIPSNRFRHLNHTEVIAISETSIRQLTYFSSCPQIRAGIFALQAYLFVEELLQFLSQVVILRLYCLRRQVRFYHLNNPVNSEDGGKAWKPGDLGRGDKTTLCQLELKSTQYTVSYENISGTSLGSLCCI